MQFKRGIAAVSYTLEVDRDMLKLAHRLTCLNADLEWKLNLLFRFLHVHHAQILIRFALFVLILLDSNLQAHALL